MCYKTENFELVRKGKRIVVICSDSPTSQYRNSKNEYLMKKITMEFDITGKDLLKKAWKNCQKYSVFFFKPIQDWKKVKIYKKQNHRSY